MTTQLTKWQAQLQTHLSQHQNAPDDHQIANSAFALAEAGLEDLKKYPAQFPFKNMADHEQYYHVVFPLFVSAHQYLGKVRRALQVKLAYDRDTYTDFLERETETVNQFLKYHLQYSQYSAFDPADTPSGSITQPTAISERKKGTTPTAAQQLQLPFHPPALKTHVDYKRFLEREKMELDKVSMPASGRVYEFVGSQADAMENIEGWTEMQVIRVNGQVATLRQVAEMWTAWFQKPIPNIYSKKRVNQERKKEKAPFITKMAEALRDAANRPRVKRRP